MRPRRVKITGIGPISPAGTGREAFLRGILEGTSHVRASRRGRAAFAAAEIAGFDASLYLPGGDSAKWPRHVQLAAAAAVLALGDAGLTVSGFQKEISTIVVSGSLGETIDRAAAAHFTARSTTLHLPEGKHAAAAGRILAEFLGAKPAPGKRHFASCCAFEAIGRAAASIASGEAEIAVCGGADAPLGDELVDVLGKLGLSSDHAEHAERQCRPFDLWRTTGVLGEGACMLVLEPEESPRPGYAFIAGHAHGTEKHAAFGGLPAAARLALANAKLRPAEVDCIHADGTGAKRLDAAEAGALKEIFGERLRSIPAAGIKGAIGNALGGGSALQVGCAALCMRHSVVPPTVNWRRADPACALNLSATARLLFLDSVFLCSRDLFGANGCLILKR